MGAGLQGKTVLLTGALGSLGRVQAGAFAAAGAEVWLLDRPELGEPGRVLAAELPGARYLGQDLRDLAATEALVAGLAAERAVDVLVNNAALILNRPFEEFSAADYEEQMRVNASAVFALARAVAPAMKAQGTGKIVNFSSVTLSGRFAGYVPYVASKGAVLGLTKALARELGPHGIRVNAVAPGAILSEAENRIAGARFAEINAWILDSQCLKSRIGPEAVADLVLFLAGPASDMITGQMIAVDGGW